MSSKEAEYKVGVYVFTLTDTAGMIINVIRVTPKMMQYNIGTYESEKNIADGVFNINTCLTDDNSKGIYKIVKKRGKEFVHFNNVAYYPEKAHTYFTNDILEFSWNNLPN